MNTDLTRKTADISSILHTVLTFSICILTSFCLDCWHQPSLLRHDSVDSGVSKGAHVGLSGGQPGWHGPSRGHDGVNQRGGGGTGVHRHWNGNFHSRKSSTFQEKLPVESREEKKEDKEQLQFEEEDFVSV